MRRYRVWAPIIEHLTLIGAVLAAAGKRQRTQEHLTTATTMFREMDMRFWLEQAEAESGALGLKRGQ